MHNVNVNTFSYMGRKNVCELNKKKKDEKYSNRDFYDVRIKKNFCVILNKMNMTYVGKINKTFF